MADNKSSEGMISKDLINPEDVNIPDVIKGLKAIQREARKATAALKELEEQQSKVIVDEAHGLCPNCRSYITTENLYADGEDEPLKQFHHCTECGWSQ